MNSRLDALQAAILRVKLPKLGQWTQGRRTNADKYREKMSGAPVELPVARSEAYHVYNQFVIRSRSRDDLRAHLQSSGIGTEIYYPEPLHLQPGLGGQGDEPGEGAAKEPVFEPAPVERQEEEARRQKEDVRLAYKKHLNDERKRLGF